MTFPRLQNCEWLEPEVKARSLAASTMSSVKEGHAKQGGSEFPTKERSSEKFFGKMMDQSYMPNLSPY